jgi:hypothetical protein
MNIEDIARICHTVNRAYCAAIGDDSQPAWEDAPDWQRQSAINGVTNIADDLRQHNGVPTIGPKASHESWFKQKEAEGWKYGPVKNPETKEHPCFVPYAELPATQRVKDDLFVAVARGLYPTMMLEMAQTATNDAIESQRQSDLDVDSAESPS